MSPTANGTTRPTGHLICGSTGAGKTTYARRLAERLEQGPGAMRFTIDEWMAALFWPDAPETGVFDWAVERTERCERQILALCGQVFARGQDAILDLGFFTRRQRARIVAGVHALGACARLHYLPVPAEERWRRVSQRNAQGGETFAIAVTREMFDFCENLFEPPDADELQGAVLAGAVPSAGVEAE